MRWLLLAALPLTALAGCTGGTSILSLGDCTATASDDDDWDGLFHECSDVAGAGTFAWTVDCPQGLLGVEREGGNGTIRVAFTLPDGTHQTHNLTGSGEVFVDFHAPGAKMNLRTTADFTDPLLAFGYLCTDQPFN